MLPLHVRHDVVEGDRLHLEADGGEELPSDGQPVHRDGGAPEHHHPSPQATLVPGAPPSMWRTESAANFLATRCAVRGRGERGRFQAPRKVV